MKEDSLVRFVFPISFLFFFFSGVAHFKFRYISFHLYVCMYRRGYWGGIL